MDDVTEFYDLWSDRSQPELRFVLPVGDLLPSLFASGTMEHFGVMRVSDDIAAEVVRCGYCFFKSNGLLDTEQVLSRTAL